MYSFFEITDDLLRAELKDLLEQDKTLTEKEIAEYLEIRQSSMYNWFAGQYNLSRKKKERLYEIIEDLRV